MRAIRWTAVLVLALTVAALGAAGPLRILIGDAFPPREKAAPLRILIGDRFTPAEVEALRSTHD